MYSRDTTRGSLRGLPNLQCLADWGDARSKAQSDFCAEGLGPCPVGVQGFESPPPHHFTSDSK